LCSQTNVPLVFPNKWANSFPVNRIISNQDVGVSCQAEKGKSKTAHDSQTAEVISIEGFRVEVFSFTH